jgi:hypothetical protein
MRQLEMRAAICCRLSTAGSDPLSKVVATLGRDSFYNSVSEALSQTIRHDIIGAYMIRSHSEMRVIFAAGGVPTNPQFSQIAARRYAADFWNDDPAIRRFLTAPETGRPKVKLQRWNEIPDGEYREFAYERPRMLERISLFREFEENCMVVSLYRTRRSGPFAEAELQSFECQSDLLTTLTIRHCELERSQAVLRPSPAVIAARIEHWPESLSPREVEVCAALLGTGAVKHALRLTNLQNTTFVTYRKRAFAKLRISTREQLEDLYETRL